MIKFSTIKNYLFSSHTIGIPMKSYMGRIGNKGHQIRRDVINLVLVEMMRWFRCLKVSTNNFFNNQAVFSNISRIGSIRMRREADKNIAIMTDAPSLPIVALVTNAYLFAKFYVAFGRAEPSSLLTKITGSNFKFFGTISTFLNHINLQIKRTLFSGVSEMVRFLHLLRVQILDIKNPLLIRKLIIPQISVEV